MKGKLYGVGVGPGDPELLTLKALRVIRSSDVIAVPGADPKQSKAYQIARQALPEIEQKENIGIVMPMTKDRQMLEQVHLEGALRIAGILETGRSVAYLTMGDVTVYSTYLYLHEQILSMGYEARIICGIPSFCAAAARLNTDLVMNQEQLHIIPASYGIEEALKLDGTKVFMKSGRRMQAVKEALMQMEAQVLTVENCGMPDEKIYIGAEQIPEDAGYYTLIIVRASDRED